MKNKIKQDDYNELEKLFDKVENMKEFKDWFGTPCPEFNPKCFNCKFWLLWNKLKMDVFEDI